jgi:hypothetical protein
LNVCHDSFLEFYAGEETVVSGVNGETRRQFYQNHIETWKKSKKSMASYGKESGLSYHAFQYWLRVSRIDTRALKADLDNFPLQPPNNKTSLLSPGGVLPWSLTIVARQEF